MSFSILARARVPDGLFYLLGLFIVCYFVGVIGFKPLQTNSRRKDKDSEVIVIAIVGLVRLLVIGYAAFIIYRLYCWWTGSV